MIKNPTKVKVEDRYYEINTDFRVAIKCYDVAQDNSISDYERAMAIIYLLFGENGINAENDYSKLLELGQKYLNLGKPLQENKNEKDMDFMKDYNLIVASFMSDFGINLEKENMHWWTFYNLLNGLSNSEFGNCCILNKVRNIRNMDITEVKDSKIKSQIIEAKEYWKLDDIIDVEYTETEIESIERFKNLLNEGGE